MSIHRGPASSDAGRTDLHDLPRACRDAALAFLNQSRSWGKEELAAWLSDSYVALVHRAEADGPVWPLPLLADIDGRLIDRIIDNARAQITRALEQMTENGSATFVLSALIDGFVVRVEEPGSTRWVPSPTAIRLVDRVFALLAVDYLARPNDYEDALVVCGRCGDVSFEAGGHQAACRCRTARTASPSMAG